MAVFGTQVIFKNDMYNDDPNVYLGYRLDVKLKRDENVLIKVKIITCDYSAKMPASRVIDILHSQECGYSKEIYKKAMDIIKSICFDKELVLKSHKDAGNLIIKKLKESFVV